MSTNSSVIVSACSDTLCCSLTGSKARTFSQILHPQFAVIAGSFLCLTRQHDTHTHTQNHHGNAASSE